MRSWLLLAVATGLVPAAGATTVTDYFVSRPGVDVALVVNEGDRTALAGPLTSDELFATYGNIGDEDWIPAVATWKHGSWPLIGVSGAEWISTSYYIGQYDGEPIGPTSWRWFKDIIDVATWAGAPITGNLKVTADNAEAVFVNGQFVGSDGEVSGTSTDNSEWSSVLDYNIGPYLVAGLNEIQILVRNYAGNNSATNNPTGLIYSGEFTYPLPVVVEIDIKPCSNPNSFNINGHGTIPVAVLGSAEFDVTTIDVTTLHFSGLTVGVRGRDKLMVSYADVTGPGDLEGCYPDGFTDLVVHFVDDEEAWDPSEGYAVLSGLLIGGTPFSGAGPINLVPND